MELLDLTAVELGKKIRQREVSAAEAVEAVFARAETAEPLLHSYVTFNREDALAQAEEVH